MKTANIVSTAMGVSLSCLLLLGEPWHDFAYYTLLVFTVLAWVGLLIGAVKEEAAAKIREGLWLSCASTAFQLYALIMTGHQLLAASSFIVSAFIVSAAFQKVDIPILCAKKSAYRRGQAAYRSGLHTNPYDLDDSRHQDWWDGYQASQAAFEKEQDHVA